MAGNIKGITIEIGGDVTKLDKALTSVNKTSKNLQTELKQVEKLLKLDPKNTELLAQKQEILKQSISETSKKLDVLKEAEKQVQTQFERGEVSEEQYRALQREIVTAESNLKSLEAEARKSNTTLAEVGTSVGKIGDAATNAGKQMMKVSAGIVAIGGAGIAAAVELDEGYDTIIQKTGATGEKLEGLQKSADNIFSNMPVEMSNVGTAIGDVSTRFDISGQALEDLSTKFLKFAEVNNTEVGTSISLVARAMGDAGIPTEQAGELMDTLTVASQKSGITIDKLTENLTKYGAPMRALGFDTKSSIAIFSSWEKAGVNTEIAFSGMKKAISNWSAEGKDAREEFGKTLEEIAACPDIASATTKSIEIFGAKAGPDLADAIQGGRFEYEDFLKLLEGSSGTIENSFDAMQDPWDKAKVSLNNVKLAGAELGTTILTMLQPTIDSTVAKIKEFTTWFKNLSDEQKQNIVKVMALVAAIGPALLIFGKMATGVSKVIGVVSNLSSGIGAASKVLTALTGPVGIVIAIIAALAAGIFYLYNTNEEFRTNCNKVFAEVKEAFVQMWTAIQPAIESLKAAFKSLMTALQPVFNFIIQYIAMIVTAVLTTVGPIIAAITDAVNFVSNIINALVALLSGDFEGFKTYLFAALQNVISFVTNILTAIINYVVSIFSSLGIDIKAVFASIWAAIVQTFQNIGQWFGARIADIKLVFSTVAAWFGTVFNEAWENIKRAFANVSTFFADLWARIVACFVNVGVTIGTAVGDAFKTAINGVLSTIEGIVNNFIGMINGVINVINEIPGVNLGKIGQLSIPKLAKGGVLKNGQAIMAEAGPELISMVNGQAVVTPLTRNAKNTSLENAGGGTTGGFNQYIYNTSPKALSPAETARQTRIATQQIVLKLRRV